MNYLTDKMYNPKMLALIQYITELDPFLQQEDDTIIDRRDNL